MPKRSFPLPFPLGGLSENLAFGSQEPATSSELVNVRAIDPVTGRIRGAQRSGMLRFAPGTATGTGKIQHVASFGYAAQMVTHTQVVDLDYLAPTADPDNLVWQKQLADGGDALDVVVDRRGDVYALTSGGIEKYNPEGERVATINVPVPVSGALLPHLAVLPSYLVLTVSRNPVNGLGTVYAFTQVERDGDSYFDLYWRIELDGPPSDFVTIGSDVAVIVEVEETDTTVAHSEIAVYSGLNAAAPFQVSRIPIPADPSAIAAGPQGALFVTHASKLNRTASPLGFTARTTDWSPHELTNAEERIYAWWDASTLMLSDGATVSGLTNRLTWAEEQGATITDRVLDDTPRPLRNHRGLGDQRNRFGPSFGISAFGEMPGVQFNKDAPHPRLRLELTSEVYPWGSTQAVTRTAIYDNWEQIPNATIRNALREAYERGDSSVSFDGNTYTLTFDYWEETETPIGSDLVTGQGLTTRANTSSEVRALVTDKSPKSRAMLPAMLDANFMVGMVVKLRHEDDPGAVDAAAAPELVFQHATPVGRATQLGLLSNIQAEQTVGDYDHATGTHTSTDGWATLFKDAASLTTITGRVDMRFDEYDQSAWDGGTANVTDSLIIVLIDDGSHASNATFFVRVNGELIGKLSIVLSQDYDGGPHAFTTFGGYVKAYKSSLDLFAKNLSSFGGAVGESITILSETDYAHPDTAPFIHGAVNTPESGQLSWGWYELTGTGGDYVIQEWDRIEGYLAHKWGLSHMLPNALAGEYQSGGSGTFYSNDHPYGGEANPPGGTTGTALNANLLALRSDGPILAKYSAGYGELKWALSTNGVGFGVAVDRDGDVLTIGEYVDEAHGFGTDTIYQLPVEDSVFISNVIARKVLDLGGSYALNIREQGHFHFLSNPNVGDTITIELDDSPGTTWEYVAGAPGILEIDQSGALDTTIGNTAEAIWVHYTGTGDWEDVIVASKDLTNDDCIVRVNLAAFPESPAPTLVLTESTSGARIAVTAFTGGVRVAGSWEHWQGFLERPVDSTNRIHADVDGDLFYPPSPGTRLIQATKLEGTSTDGTTSEIVSLLFRPDTSFPGGSNYRYTTSGIAFATDPPVYSSESITGPEFMYVSTDTGRPGTSPGGEFNTDNEGFAPTLHKIRLVESARDLDQLSPRAHRNVSVRSGNVETFGAGGYGAVSGGTGALAASTNLFASTVLFNKLYLSDGLTSVVYDPRENTVSAFEATLGEVPKRIRLMTGWRGRLVVVTEDDPNNWKMSRLGTPTDFEEFPEIATAEQAVSGNNPRSLGKNPDIITALIPWHVGGQSEPLLVLGGDHSIHLMMGDPMAVALGGFGQRVISEVSIITGIAFGSAWAQSPEGALFFFGSKGGVWRWALGSIPERISLHKIERQLSDVDLNAYRIELVWNYREEGLHVLQLPVLAGGAPIHGWFWERKTDSWWKDEFGATDVQPTAAVVVDGDLPGDRRLVFGCEDGAIRSWDETATNDDGARIYSQALLGPLAPQSFDREFRITALDAVLASTQGGVTLELYTSDTPDARTLVSSHKLTRGRNQRIAMRARGSNLWVRLYNAATTERWALESLAADIAPAGRKRVRN